MGPPFWVFSLEGNLPETKKQIQKAPARFGRPQKEGGSSIDSNHWMLQVRFGC